MSYSQSCWLASGRSPPQTILLRLGTRLSITRTCRRWLGQETGQSGKTILLRYGTGV